MRWRDIVSICSYYNFDWCSIVRSFFSLLDWMSDSMYSSGIQETNYSRNYNGRITKNFPKNFFLYLSQVQSCISFCWVVLLTFLEILRALAFLVDVITPFLEVSPLGCSFWFILPRVPLWALVYSWGWAVFVVVTLSPLVVFSLLCVPVLCACRDLACLDPCVVGAFGIHVASLRVSVRGSL